MENDGSALYVGNQNVLFLVYLSHCNKAWFRYKIQKETTRVHELGPHIEMTDNVPFVLVRN